MSDSNLPFTPRSLAIAIWSFAIGWLALVSPGVSAGASFWLMLLISTASSIALLLAVDHSPPHVHAVRQNTLLFVVVSWLVPILWGIVLGGDSPSTEQILLLATGIVPVAATGIFTTFWMPRGQHVVHSEPAHVLTNTISPPQPISPPEKVSQPLGQPTPDENEDLEAESEPLLGFEPIDFDSPDATEITQWQTRSRRETGEVVEGGIRIEFAEGQREVTVHVSFCPALRQSPELVTEDLDGTDLEIRVAASYPFGARLTVRRPLRSNDRSLRTPAETCRIGFVAISHAAQRAA